MRADADAIDDAEGAALLNWFADGAMTLLGYHVEKPDESPADALGLFRIPGQPTDKGGCVGAMNYFAKGGRSEEHTSELQSLMRISYAVFCLKKKTKKQEKYIQMTTIIKR